ncbi:MAG: VCBS repeat-containing protein [Myxococcales bacterium]|nr:VCBS repeat-containing protein [Myxococcales bacterium]
MLTDDMYLFSGRSPESAIPTERRDISHRRSKKVGAFLAWTLLISALALLSWRPAYGNGVSPSILILPKGPGSIGGVGENVQANLNMGLMSYAIPIKLPEGRSKFSPSLTVSYSSSGGSGVMGIGWQLQGVDSVERLTVRGLPRYGQIQDPALQGEDSFYGPSGELVRVPNTRFYRVRYEGGFIRFRWHQSESQAGYWTAEYPDGSISFFGAAYTPNASRKVDVTQAQVDLESHVRGDLGTFRWQLRSQVDPHGNRIEYKYFRDGNQLYLTSIEWVFPEDTSKGALYKVQLDYQTRPDPVFDGKPGFACTTTKRVEKISVFSAGQSFRSYRFAYDPNSRLSRLVNVTEFGTDDKTPYPVRFTMQYSSADYNPNQAMMKKIDQSVAQDFTTGNSDLIDMNGDGLPDIVDTAQPTHTFNFNTMTVKDLKQDQHNFSAPVANPENTSARLSNDQVQMLDFNGDGFTDLVDASNQKIYINKGNGKWEDQSAKLLGQFPNPSSQAPNRRFFDYNGDKAIDVIEINGEDVIYWVSDGKGSWTSVTGKQSLGADFAKDKLQLIDMNGDGLADAVQFFGGKLRYRTYFGYGKWSDWINVQIEGLTQELSDKARFRDINGDGLADMVAFVANTVKFFVNLNGTAFAAGEDLNAKFQGIDIPDSDPQRVTIRIADINGNGSRDIVWLDSSGKITYLELFSQRPNLLTSIDNGIGKKIEVSYGSSVYHSLRDKAAGKPWPSKLPNPFIVVNQIKTWASLDANDPAKGCPEIQNIAYHDGYYDGIEKKFRGFRRVESTIVGDQGPNCPTSVGQRTENLRFFVGDGNTASGDNDNYYHGKMRENTVTGTDGTGKITTFYSSTMEWGDCTLTAVPSGLSPAVRYICLKSQENIVKEGQDQSKWKTQKVEYAHDGFGNVILTKNLGDTSMQGDEQFTKMTYTAPSDPLSESPEQRWFLRALVQREICEKEAGPCAVQKYFYDGKAFEGLPAGQITRGLLSRTSAVPAEGAEPINLQRFEYDVYGNIIGIKNPNGHLRTGEWDDTYHRFPIKESIVLKDLTLTVTSEWDFRFSTVIQSADWNGHISLYGYDSFGRLTSLTRAGDAVGKPSEVYTYNLGAPLSTIVIEKRSQKGGELDTKMIQCFDGMGRKIQVRTATGNGAFVVSQHTLFNSAGLPARHYNPYSSDQEACAFAAPESVPFIEKTYDGLNRLVQRADQAKGLLRVQYLPQTQIVFDEEDNRQDSPHFNTPTTIEFDGLKRMIKKTKLIASGKPHVETFAWSFLNIYSRNVMLSMDEVQGNTKTQKLDYLGRVIETDDPDRKTIRYTYDANGNMIKRTDVRGTTLLYTYDELNRMRSVQQEGKDETKIAYHFDQAFEAPSGETFLHATNLKARLAGISYPGGYEAFGYDKRGNLTHSRRVTLGVNFDFETGFDNLNRIISRTFPDGRTLNYTYDQAERLTSIKGFIKSVAYGENALMKGWTLENGVETKLTLDQRLLLQHLSVGDGKIVDYTYAYDGKSNILSIDKKVGETQESHAYQYDAIYRLTQASLGNKEVLSYAYSNNNNILSKESSLKEKSLAHLGTYAYDPARPRAVTKAGSLSLTYNDVGSISKDNTFSYTFDHLDRQIAVSAEGKEMGRYWYDGRMARLIKREHGVHTVYLNDYYEIREGYAVIYVRMGQLRIAAWKSAKGAARIYDNLDKTDEKITATDAWLYQKSQSNGGDDILQRPIKTNLVRDMLQNSLARMFSEDKEEKVYFHADHLGSTVAVTDQQGALIGTQSYYPFGAVRSQTGNTFRFGYMDTERDELTKNNYAHHRYLNTRLGRWISTDPMFEQLGSTNDEFNSYGYVLNNPIRYRDSQGTAAEDTTAGDSPSNTDKAVPYVAAGVAVVAVGVLSAGLIAEARKWNKQNKNNKTNKFLAVSKLLFGAGGAITSAIGVSNDDSLTKIIGGVLIGTSGLAAIGQAIIDAKTSPVKHEEGQRKDRKLQKAREKEYLRRRSGQSSILSRSSSSKTVNSVLTRSSSGSAGSFNSTKAIDGFGNKGRRNSQKVRKTKN